MTGTRNPLPEGECVDKNTRLYGKHDDQVTPLLVVSVYDLLIQNSLPVSLPGSGGSKKKKSFLGLFLFLRLFPLVF